MSSLPQFEPSRGGTLKLRYLWVVAIPFVSAFLVLLLFLWSVRDPGVEPIPWDTAKWHEGLHARYAMRASLNGLLMEGFSIATVQELLGAPIFENVVGDSQAELELTWSAGYDSRTSDEHYMCALFRGDPGEEKLVSWEIGR